jgi:Homeodomain-like domain
MLVRRADGIAVIGAALLAKAAGAGHRRIAAMFGRPGSTVRGWLRRFSSGAGSLRVLFTGLRHRPDQRRLVDEGGDVADALRPVGDRHRQIGAATRAEVVALARDADLRP